MADPLVNRYLPQVGHWDRAVGINQDGAVFAMLHVAGLPAELAGAAAIYAAHQRDNQLDRSLSDPRVEIWDHQVRQDSQDMMPLPAVPNWFGARFDDAYRAAQGVGSLYRNDLFVTVLLHSEDRLRSGLQSLFGGRVKEHPQASERLVAELEGVMQKVEAGLSRYGVRRLGLREQDGVVFSELAEALHLIACNHFQPIGLSSGRLGRLVVPHRLVFGMRDVQIMREGAPLFSAILSMLEYPARTSPTMFADLRRAPFPLTITNSRRFRQKADALGKIGMRVKQMQSGNDVAKSQMQELAQDEDDVMSGRSVYVSHHLSISVYAGSLDDLDQRVARVQSLLSDVGITSVRETDALMPAFFAQLPGNSRWRTRSALTKSINALGFAAKHGVPRGQSTGRWGAPIVMLRTTSDTEYAFHLQVQGSAQIPAEDLANCLVFGPAGSGKTGLMGSMCLLALRNAAARVVIVDKDYGLSVMVREPDAQTAPAHAMRQDAVAVAAE